MVAYASAKADEGGAAHEGCQSGQLTASGASATNFSDGAPARTNLEGQRRIIVGGSSGRAPPDTIRPSKRLEGRPRGKECVAVPGALW